MDLKTFVSETLIQIMSGVQEAKTKHQRGPFAGDISPQYRVREVGTDGVTPLVGVEFDVALTVSEEAGKKGGIGVVSGVVSFGGRAESSNSSQTVSRIKFKVPLILPGTEE